MIENCHRTARSVRWYVRARSDFLTVLIRGGKYLEPEAKMLGVSFVGKF